MNEIEKALQELQKAIENSQNVKQIKITLTLKKSEQSSKESKK